MLRNISNSVTLPEFRLAIVFTGILLGRALPHILEVVWLYFPSL